MIENQIVPKPPKRKRKPKRAVVTPEMIAEVKRLAGLGLTNVQLGGLYGMSDETWVQRVKEHPELAEAVRLGKSETLGKVTGKLMEAIERGNLAAIIFFLKTQGRWRETDHAGDNGSGDKPPFPAITLTVNDPVEAAKIYQQIMIGS